MSGQEAGIKQKWLSSQSLITFDNLEITASDGIFLCAKYTELMACAFGTCACVHFDCVCVHVSVFISIHPQELKYTDMHCSIIIYTLLAVISDDCWN